MASIRKRKSSDAATQPLKRKILAVSTSSEEFADELDTEIVDIASEGEKPAPVKRTTRANAVRTEKAKAEDFIYRSLLSSTPSGRFPRLKDGEVHVALDSKHFDQHYFILKKADLIYHSPVLKDLLSRPHKEPNPHYNRGNYKTLVYLELLPGTEDTFELARRHVSLRKPTAVVVVPQSERISSTTMSSSSVSKMKRVTASKESEKTISIDCDADCEDAKLIHLARDVRTDPQPRKQSEVVLKDYSKDVKVNNAHVNTTANPLLPNQRPNPAYASPPTPGLARNEQPENQKLSHKEGDRPRTSSSSPHMAMQSASVNADTDLTDGKGTLDDGVKGVPRATIIATPRTKEVSCQQRQSDTLGASFVKSDPPLNDSTTALSRNESLFVSESLVSQPDDETGIPCAGNSIISETTTTVQDGNTINAGHAANAIVTHAFKAPDIRAASSVSPKSAHDAQDANDQQNDDRNLNESSAESVSHASTNIPCYPNISRKKPAAEWIATALATETSTYEDVANVQVQSCSSPSSTHWSSAEGTLVSDADKLNNDQQLEMQTAENSPESEGGILDAEAFGERQSILSRDVTSADIAPALRYGDSVGFDAHNVNNTAFSTAATTKYNLWTPTTKVTASKIESVSSLSGLDANVRNGVMGMDGAGDSEVASISSSRMAAMPQRSDTYYEACNKVFFKMSGGQSTSRRERDFHTLYQISRAEVMVAESLGCLATFRPAIRAEMHQYGRELHLFAAKFPEKMLILSIKLECRSIFDEAYIHMVGRSLNMERIVTNKSPKLIPHHVWQYLRTDIRRGDDTLVQINEKLLLSNLNIDAMSVSLDKRGDSTSSFLVMSIWRQWFIAEYTKVQCQPKRLGRFYQTISTGGESYLPLSETIESLQRCFKSAYDEDWLLVKKDLDMIKQFAAKLVAPLVECKATGGARAHLTFIGFDGFANPWDHEDEMEED